MVQVAPLVGAWIESSTSVLAAQVTFVAPLVGAWIESPDGGQQVSKDTVAPLVGAWIERIVRMHLVCIEQSLLL